MSGRIDKFQFCPNCFASQDSITELPSSDNDFLCTACDQELFYDVPYTECYEQEITRLKKALSIANEAITVSANQLEGIGLAFTAHGTNLNVKFMIENSYENARQAREAQKQIKEVMEWK